MNALDAAMLRLGKAPAGSRNPQIRNPIISAGFRDKDYFRIRIGIVRRRTVKAQRKGHQKAAQDGSRNKVR
jgi:hypothetical protein